MSQEEIYGTRGMEYSAWHRRLSTGRFVGSENAQLLAMIDLDVTLYVEYEDGNKKPICLIEVAMDIGQTYKTATVTKNLAEMAGIPAYVVLYKLSEKNNPANDKYKDIDGFRTQRLNPNPEGFWTKLTPNEYAHNLLSMRKRVCDEFDSNHQ